MLWKDLQIIEVLLTIGIDNKGFKNSIRKRRTKKGAEAKVTRRKSTKIKREGIDHDQNNLDRDRREIGKVITAEGIRKV